MASFPNKKKQKIKKTGDGLMAVQKWEAYKEKKKIENEKKRGSGHLFERTFVRIAENSN